MHTIIDSPVGLSIETVRQQVVGIDTQIPLFDGTQTPYINFDNAASTPTLHPILNKINELMVWYSSIHRGTGFKSQISSELYDLSREIVAQFFGLSLAENHTVIFVKNTTEAINKLAFRFPFDADDVVLVSRMEHHSNDLPWRRQAKVVYIEVDDLGRLRMDDLQAKLAHYAGKVKLVAITGASNVTGWVNDIHHIAELAHAHGARILVDAAQLAPHRKINMRSQNDPGHIDFLAFSGHKIYAPFGGGALLGDADIFETGEPDMVGGGTVAIVSYDKAVYLPPPESDEAGTPNTVGVIAMAKALLTMEEIGMEAVVRHEEHLTRYALEKMQGIPNLNILGSANPQDAPNRLGVIAFNVGDLPHALTAAILNHEGGIGVRNGCFCAHPYLKLLMNISEAEAEQMEAAILAGDRSKIPGAVRVSFGIYNTTEEIDHLITVLEKIANHRWEGKYELNKTTGAYELVGYNPHFENYFKL